MAGYLRVFSIYGVIGSAYCNKFPLLFIMIMNLKVFVVWNFFHHMKMWLTIFLFSYCRPVLNNNWILQITFIRIVCDRIKIAAKRCKRVLIVKNIWGHVTSSKTILSHTFVWKCIIINWYLIIMRNLQLNEINITEEKALLF